jgi:CheY-like chemotaxis protein
MKMGLKATVLKSFVLNIMLFCSVFALDTPTVSVSPDTANYFASYTINSKIRNPFPLIQVEANIDSLAITFNSNTNVPSSIDPSSVTVNGIVSSRITVAGQRISILIPVELRNYLSGTRDITIVISKAAKIRNPATSGNYTLGLQAVQSNGNNIDGPSTSSSYSITTSSSMISEPSVAPSHSIAGQAAVYNISFDVGKGGFLTAGVSTMSVGFDPNTTVTNGSLSGVTINGTPATATANNDTVVVTTPSNIDIEGAVSLVFASGSGIFNPSTGGNYTLGVSTSSESTIVEAQNGKNALQLIKKGNKSIDIIVTDLIMPEMNGQEFVSQVHKFFPDLKVLYVSGYTFEYLLKDGEIEENINFLQKPYMNQDILKKIREILDN